MAHKESSDLCTQMGQLFDGHEYKDILSALVAHMSSMLTDENISEDMRTDTINFLNHVVLKGEAPQRKRIRRE